MKPVDVTVAVVNWNTLEELRDCLASALEHYQDFRYEIVVVDNASHDGSPDMVREEFPQVRLIANTDNVGFARANNQIIDDSSGRYLLLLNSDTITVDNSVKTMVDYMDAHPEVGIVGGMLRNRDGSFQASHARFPSLRTEFLLATGLGRRFYLKSFPSYGEEASACKADWVGGAFLMARRAAVDQVGGLDEDFFMYSEETEWCYRMRKSGWEVHHLPAAKVIHLLGVSSAKSSEPLARRLVEGRLKFYSKHHSAPMAWTFRFFLFASNFARAVLWSVRRALSRGDAAAEAAERSRIYYNISRLALGRTA